MRLLLFTKVLLTCIVANVLLFEFAGDSSLLIQKELQFIEFIKNSSFPILTSLAEYIHRRAPWLEAIPYEAPHTDSRLSTWYLPPQQVVAEWVGFMLIFALTLSYGAPRVIWIEKNRRTSRGQTLFAFVLFQMSLGTLVAILFFKIRAFTELGEWFALLYLLQPCHVLITAYAVLGYMIWRPDGTSAVHAIPVTLFHVLFDLQWFTWVAISLPDLDALLERQFFGEFFLFYFEHLYLVLLPYMYLRFFGGAVHFSWGSRFHRAMHSLAWFGMHHIQVMTPVSLVSGVQVNYQTHLPQYALHWFGRAYKSVITLVSFVLIMIFAFFLDPLAKRAVIKLHFKKRL